RHRHALPELAHQIFGGVSQRLKPWQSEKSAGALDGVDEAKNVVEDVGVVGILLETDQLDVDNVEAFVGLGEEFVQQVVHGNSLRPGNARRNAAVAQGTVSLSGKRLVSVATRPLSGGINRSLTIVRRPDRAD